MAYQEQLNSLNSNSNNPSEKGLNLTNLKKNPLGKNNKDLLTPKWLLVFITFLAVVSLIFAVINWFDSLKIGFALRGGTNQDVFNSNSSLENSDVVNILALQQKDTDLDGLSDYDELYVYKTSPYLADSDSDGFSDGVEVQNNENPNCPAGQSCVVASQLPTASSFAELSSLSAEQIRQLLIDRGMDPEEVAKIDDESLIELYQETLSEVGSATSTSQGGGTTDAILMTPAQIRALLITEGAVKAEDLEQLSDEQLMQLWQELLQQSSQ